MAAIVGCADSRAPVETIFDAKPGDIFVLRNAGNTCTHAEGSFVGSLEFAVANLNAKLIVVMGHTKCGALAGATKTMLSMKAAGHKFGHEAEDEHDEAEEQQSTHDSEGDDDVGEGAAEHQEHVEAHDAPAEKQEPSSELESLLIDLAPIAAEAADDLPEDASAESIAAHTGRLNVFHTVDCILTRSKLLRDRVRDGDVLIQGAIYDLETGQVDFLGESPNQDNIVR